MKKIIVALILLILVSGCIGAGNDTKSDDEITSFDNNVDSLEGLDKELSNGDLDNLDNDLNFDL